MSDTWYMLAKKVPKTRTERYTYKGWLESTESSRSWMKEYIASYPNCRIVEVTDQPSPRDRLTLATMPQTGSLTIRYIADSISVGENGEFPKSMWSEVSWLTAEDFSKNLNFPDLTDDEEDDIITDMSKDKNTKIASLIPQADKYLDNGFNVLLIGPHGTGKTQSLLDLCAEKNINFKYFSCSTLDPFTDLVGVPFPEKGEDGVKYLEMVRPRDIDEAELIFFDEFNRADAKTMNAIFEIIQFKSINGEPLPNLKACWAAMNPPEDEYQVNPVDPALLDRFDLFIPIEPQPSVDYMAQFMPKEVAEALKMWWDAHERKRDNDLAKNPESKIGYVSPRRLHKIGMVWMATQNVRSVKSALPPDEQFDTGKLVTLLRAATNGESKESEGGLGDMAGDFEYTPTGILRDRELIAEYLQKNPMNLDTHKEVLAGLEAGVGGKLLVEQLGEVLDAISPAQLEAFLSRIPDIKVNQMRMGYKQLHADNKGRAESLKNLHKTLAKGARPGSFPTI